MAKIQLVDILNDKNFLEQLGHNVQCRDSYNRRYGFCAFSDESFSDASFNHPAELPIHKNPLINRRYRGHGKAGGFFISTGNCGLVYVLSNPNGVGTSFPVFDACDVREFLANWQEDYNTASLDSSLAGSYTSNPVLAVVRAGPYAHGMNISLLLLQGKARDPFDVRAFLTHQKDHIVSYGCRPIERSTDQVVFYKGSYDDYVLRTPKDVLGFFNRLFNVAYVTVRGSNKNSLTNKDIEKLEVFSPLIEAVTA